jgi:hypothetical protein
MFTALDFKEEHKKPEMDLNIPPLKTNNEAAKNDTRTTLPSSPSNSKLNNVTDPSSELTEEDIFLMKNLSEKFNQVNEDQSAFSQVDSQSKCDDDVGDETTSQTNFDQNDDLGVAIPVGSTESNNKLPPTPSNNYVSYAQAVKHGRRVSAI